MKTIGYIRISTDKQDLSKQKHLLLTYAQRCQWVIHEFIEVEASSSKSQIKRKIDVLLSTLQSGDRLLVAELSRLGRNMLETLSIINKLTEKKIDVIFIRQPELSTNLTHSKLLLAIYSYFAEAERDYISMRTKQGLAAAKAAGKQLGRPKGSKNKKGRALDIYRVDLKRYLELKLSITSIMKIINPQLPQPLSYHTYRYYIQHDNDLLQVKNS